MREGRKHVVHQVRRLRCALSLSLFCGRCVYSSLFRQLLYAHVPVKAKYFKRCSRWRCSHTDVQGDDGSTAHLPGTQSPQHCAIHLPSTTSRWTKQGVCCLWVFIVYAYIHVSVRQTSTFIHLACDVQKEVSQTHTLTLIPHCVSHQVMYELRTYQLHPGYGSVPKLIETFAKG